MTKDTTSSPRPVSIAIAGLGNWGRNHVRTFGQMPDAHLAALADQSEKVLAKYKNQYPHTRLVTDIRDVLGDPSIEGVVVATPATAHAAVALAALDAGKHVFVEKPMALEVSDAEAMVAKARAKKRILMVGHLLIYHPAVATVKALIDSGEIGEVYYLYSQRVNLGVIRKDENALWSFAPHDIAVICHLLGEVPDRVTAQGESYLQKGIEDVVFLQLHFPDRRMASIQLSWLDPHKLRKLTIVGSKKMVVFDDQEASEKVKVYDKGVAQTGEVSYGEILSLRFGDILIPKIDAREPLVAECRHFLDCIREGKESLTPGESGAEVVRILEKAGESLRKGGVPVSLKDIAKKRKHAE
ncbi:MAG: Gfo/Idh/MocA family oxidoreductase [Planctomycetota bacterium]